MPPYDFAAADRLSQQLAQLTARIEWLVGLRDSQRKALLGKPGSDNWTGERRGTYEDHFGGQQKALRHIAAQARVLKGKVDAATREAHTEQKNSRRTGG